MEFKFLNSEMMKDGTNAIISNERIARLEPPVSLVLKYKSLNNIRRIGDVRWDEISKSPEEAKICWEVAVEEIKDHRKLIKNLGRTAKDLKRKVARLKSIIKFKKRTQGIKNEQGIQKQKLSIEDVVHE